MSKEYLEALEHIYYGSQGYGETDKYYKFLKNYLESIDNANPSEALECVDDIYRNAVFVKKEVELKSFTTHHKLFGESPETSKTISEQCTTIKQALLKAQYYNSNSFKGSKEVKIEIPESSLMDYNPVKQYLKWEDLEFSKEFKVLNVKMNDTDYILRYTLDIFGGKCCFLYDEARNHHIDLTRQFFNNLHLERVEE